MRQKSKQHKILSNNENRHFLHRFFNPFFAVPFSQLAFNSIRNQLLLAHEDTNVLCSVGIKEQKGTSELA